jgi:trimeric autotransporter adhesin
MGVTGVTNFTDQKGQTGSVEQQQGQQVAGHGSFRGHRHERMHGGEDHFTNSSRQSQGSSAEDAGLFTVQNVQVFSATAVFMLAQTSSSANGPSATTTPSPSTASAGVSSTTSTNPQTGSTSSNAAAPTDPTTTSAPAASSTTPVASATGSAAANSVVVPASSSTATTGSASTSGTSALRGLNNSLAALGLNQQEIQAFDQVASLIQSLSPEAFSALATAFQPLAQDVSQGASASSAPADSTTSAGSTPSTSSSPASATTNTSDPTGTSATPTSSANSAPSGGLQVDEIVVRFSEVSIEESSSNALSERPGNTSAGASQVQGSTGGSANTLAFQAYSLQVEEFSATVQGTSGQANQGQAPSETATAS